jgi:hypothetical protein
MVSGLTAKDYEGRCKEIGLQTLEERRNQDMAQVYRYKMGIGGIEQNMFERLDARQGVATRAASGHSNYKVPAARGEIRKNSFAVRTVKEWNGLPENIKASRNCDQFKRAIKKWWENGGRPL